jgi:HD-like signal output (HDOD) protein
MNNDANEKLTLDQESTEHFDRQLEESLREIGIPPRPKILEQINLETRSGDPDFNHLADLIQCDVALAAGLIKTANSPFFGYRNKTRNVRGALLMLGLKSSANAVAGLILKRVFPPPPELQRFWGASQRTGELSAWLAGRLGVRFGVKPEDAYTFGLFRDCGIPVLMRRFEGYAQTLGRANLCRDRSFIEVEEDDLPTNHAVVGSLMAQSWWLPEEVCTAIRRHHDHALFQDQDTHSPAQGATCRHVALAQLAEKLHQDTSGLSRTCEWEKLGGDCLKSLGLTEDDLPELDREAEKFLAEMPDCGE